MSEITQEQQTELYQLSLPQNNFISTYDVAYDIVNNASLSHTGLWDLIKACQKHISGEKPNSQDELKKKGLGWVWNFNYGKARAKIEKGVAESTSKLSSALALGYVTFRNKKKGDEKDQVLSFLLDDQKRGIVSSAIGCALSSTLAKETRLSGWLNDIEYPSYAFGYCALIFDKFDWMPMPTHPLDLAFKPNTKPDKIEQWIVFKLMEATELYDRWIDARNEHVSVSEDDVGRTSRISSSGWNLEGLEAILLKAFKGKINDNKSAETWEEVIPLFTTNPSYVMVNTESVNIAKIFHRELDGTLSEVYIAWDNPWQNTTNRAGDPVNITNTTNNIIFSKNHGKYDQKLHINLIRDSGFTSDSGCIQDYRGIAKFSVEDSIRYNRLRNGIGNKMQFVGSPMFEQPQSQSGEKFKVTVSQGFVLLPASHQLVEKQPAFDIASHINVLRFEEGEYNRDTQQYDATIQGRLTSRPNKGEVQRITEEVEFTDAAKNNIKFRDYAAVFSTVLSRIHKVKCKKTDSGYDGKIRFYETVKKYLPWLVEEDEDVDKILDAIDSFVMDPIITNVETITIALQMAETPFARNRLKRMLLIAKGFPIEEVNITVPLITDKFTNMQDSRIATFENDMFFTTNEIVIAGTDDHIVHLDTHLAKSDRVIMGVKEQALSPVDAYKYLENNLAHAAQHTKMLGENPIFNKLALEYMGKIKNFEAMKNDIKALAEQIIKDQQAKEQQIQLDPATQADIAAKNAKVLSDNERKDWLAAQRTDQRDKQIDLTHEEQMRKIELENERKMQQL